MCIFQGKRWFSPLNAYFSPAPSALLSCAVALFSIWQTSARWQYCFFYSNIQSLFPVERPSRHDFGLVIKGKLMSPKDFQNTLHARMWYFKAFPFPIIECMPHSKRKNISANTRINQSTRINIVYSRESHRICMDFMHNL